jgi:hypothetical protein
MLRTSLIPSVALSLFVILPTILTGQGFVNAKYAGEFLSLGAGARSSGMGGTGTASANDVTAGYFNPAGLSNIDYPEIALFHESRFSGLFNYDYLAGAIPIDPTQTVGLSLIRFGYGEIKDTRGALIDRNGNGIIDEDDRIDPARVRIGSAADWGAIGSYARRINEKLSLGGNVKILYRSILDTSAWGFGFDVGARYSPIEQLTLGASLQDATKSVLAWETGHQEFIVPSLRLGAAYRLDAGTDHSVTPAIDAIFRFEGRSETAQADLGIASLDAAAGLEYGFRNRLFGRVGFTELEQLTIGAGVRLPKLNIDYSFSRESADLDGVGATHRVSLKLTLEEARFRREPTGE